MFCHSRLSGIADLSFRPVRNLSFKKDRLSRHDRFFENLILFAIMYVVMFNIRLTHTWILWNADRPGSREYAGLTFEYPENPVTLGANVE
jgi:hypothetical protein